VIKKIRSTVLVLSEMYNVYQYLCNEMIFNGSGEFC